MHRHRSACLAALMVTAALLLPSCDSSSSPTDPSGGLPPWAGDWQGTTAQGRAISFTVGGTALAPRITVLAFTVQIDMPAQGPGPLQCVGAEAEVNTDMADVPIVNGSWDVVSEGGGPLAGFSVGFSGSFDSTTSASGLVTAETPPTAGCVGRAEVAWTAGRV